MRADLQNYLIAKSQGGIGGSRKNYGSGRYSGAQSVTSSSSMIQPVSDGHIDFRSDRLTKHAPSVAQMKALHDSCYIPPV